MREFNEREKEIIRQLVDFYQREQEKEGEGNLSTLGLFLAKNFFTSANMLALGTRKQGLEFVLFFPSKETPLEKKRKFHNTLELIFLFEYLYENRYINTHLASPKADTELLICFSHTEEITLIKDKYILNPEGEHIKWNVHSTDNEPISWYDKDDNVIYSGIKLNLDRPVFFNLMISAIFISNDLRQLVSNGFKTPEQQQYETQLAEARKQTRYARWTFCASLIAIVISSLAALLTRCS